MACVVVAPAAGVSSAPLSPRTQHFLLDTSDAQVPEELAPGLEEDECAAAGDADGPISERCWEAERCELEASKVRFMQAVQRQKQVEDSVRMLLAKLGDDSSKAKLVPSPMVLERAASSAASTTPGATTPGGDNTPTTDEYSPKFGGGSPFSDAAPSQRQAAVARLVRAGLDTSSSLAGINICTAEAAADGVALGESPRDVQLVFEAGGPEMLPFEAAVPADAASSARALSAVAPLVYEASGAQMPHTEITRTAAAAESLEDWYALPDDLPVVSSADCAVEADRLDDWYGLPDACAIAPSFQPPVASAGDASLELLLDTCQQADLAPATAAGSIGQEIAISSDSSQELAMSAVTVIESDEACLSPSRLDEASLSPRPDWTPQPSSSSKLNWAALVAQHRAQEEPATAHEAAPSHGMAEFANSATSPTKSSQTGRSSFADQVQQASLRVQEGQSGASTVFHTAPCAASATTTALDCEQSHSPLEHSGAQHFATDPAWYGWSMQTTPEGHIFYYHQQTMTSQWHQPQELSAVLGEWEEAMHDGNTYWFNSLLHTSSWHDPRRTTSLFQAALSGDVAFAQLYVQAGGCLDIADASGGTALHVAAACGNAAMAEQLLCSGASPDLMDLEGATPLHWACRCGSAAVASLLLGAGARPGVADGLGDTALHAAAEGGFVDVVKTLLLAGALPGGRSPNHRGMTPLELAQAGGAWEVAATIRLHSGHGAFPAATHPESRRASTNDHVRSAARPLRQASQYSPSPAEGCSATFSPASEAGRGQKIAWAMGPLLRGARRLAARLLEVDTTRTKSWELGRGVPVAESRSRPSWLRLAGLMGHVARVRQLASSGTGEPVPQGQEVQQELDVCLLEMGLV